jgi:hypothetical protein
VQKSSVRLILKASLRAIQLEVRRNALVDPHNKYVPNVRPCWPTRRPLLLTPSPWLTAFVTRASLASPT